MHSYKVIIMPSAINNLLDIAEYIALDNSHNAIAFINELESAVTTTLSIIPYAGKITQTTNLNAEIRMIPYKNYNAYYQILESNATIEILFIFNANQNIDL